MRSSRERVSHNQNQCHRSDNHASPIHHIDSTKLVKFHISINCGAKNRKEIAVSIIFASFYVLRGFFIGHHGAFIVPPPEELPQRLPYNKRARDGKYIEQLGTFDPLPNIYNEKLVSFNFDRIKYWIGCGAHPTKPVAKLLGLSGFFPLHPMTVTEAERRRAQAKLAETAEGTEDSQEGKQTQI
ncbi:hypothetical protein ATANTOWER_009207 [Ataeniobius toweri]|uniref:Small ribosomal subunit protein bS16m n=1 Tax=Ataeniobius toweri TaxID=208326 RepID=A0ABU7AWU6_9TELE|nr:hypothetical protein [Ataeniobius toweri]